MEVRIKKETDRKELKKNLMKIDSKFFETCRLDILKRPTIRRFTCADATNLNDDKKNKIALTSCNDLQITIKLRRGKMKGIKGSKKGFRQNTRSN